ncbi:MAG: ABC transporter permease [Pirellulaceae bacterium]
MRRSEFVWQSFLALILITLLPGTVVGQSGKKEYLCLRSINVDVTEGQFSLSGSYGLTRNDLYYLPEVVPEATSAVALRTMTHLTSYRQSDSNAVIIGTSSEKLAVLAGIEIDSGRFLEQHEIESAENVCVIGRRIAGVLFQDDDPTGKSIRLGQHYFLVVGVARSPQIQLDSVEEAYATSGMPEQATSGPATQNLEVYVSLPAMKMRFGDLVVRRGPSTFVRRSYELSEVWIPDATDIQAIRQVELWLGERHEFQEDFHIRARRAW